VRKPTASNLERGLKCAASLHLPIIESTSEAADRGIWRHAFLARIREVGAEAALAEVPKEHRDACAALPIDELPVDLMAEVALAFDVASSKGRVVGSNLGRDYGELGPMELVGSADVIGLSDDRVLVIDWKSAGHKGRASDSVQLKFLALAACRAYDRDAATVEIVKLGDGGEVHRSRHDYNAFDLDMFAEELRAWFAKAGKDKTPVEGSHCTYCKSWQFCDAKTGLIRMAATGQDIAGPFMGGLSRSTVGAAFVLAENLRSMARELEKRVAAAVEELGPCETGRGTTIQKALVEGNETLDGDVVFKTVAGRYGQAVADQAVRRTATKVSIKAALKAAGLKVTQAEREVLDEVRANGGTKRTMSERLVEVEEKRRAG
jgi:hypothetical protein